MIARKVLFLTTMVFASLSMSGCIALAAGYVVANSQPKAYEPTIYNRDTAATLKVIGGNAIGVTVYPDADCYSHSNPEKRKLSGRLAQSLRSAVNGPETQTFNINADKPITLQMGYASSVAYCTSNQAAFFVPKEKAFYETYLSLADSKCTLVVNEISKEGRVAVQTQPARSCK